jgi:tetratricopeptide (TPR) repeat protein
MLYNWLRFDSPFEFGARYQLAGDRQLTRQFFSLRYLWFNFRLYFLTTTRWSGQFPFVHDIPVPPLPAGHGRVEQTFGILTNIPLVWLALATPLAWRSRSADARSRLCAFLAVVAALFGIGALTMSLFFAACARYEVEFLPALVLLAVIGILSVERTLAPTSESGLACRPLWRRAARCGWGVLLAFSVAFNLLESVERCAEAHNNLGMVLQREGRMQEAMGQYKQSVRLRPANAEAQYNLGLALARLGRMQEATGQYEQALRLKPDFAEAHNDLGTAFFQLGRLKEAIGQYEQALRLKTDFADAHYNLGNGLLQAGRTQEAMGQYEQALRLRPDFAEAHNNLGLALARTGQVPEAIQHWEQALRIKPDFIQAQSNLARARAVQ